MGVDYVIDYACRPKEALSTSGILVRLKAGERAESIIALYRDNGDMRPPVEMGFEMVRRTAEGAEETQVVIVQSLLDEAAQLAPYEHFCEGCPANVQGRPFGCFGRINYPISRAAELWMLRRLPIAEEPLVFLLLRDVISESRELATQAAQIRETSSAIFETKEVFGRVVEGITATTNHLFGLLFLTGASDPIRSVMLLLFMGAIPRDMEADALQSMTPAPPDARERFPFLLSIEDADDETTRALKGYFAALYTAYLLNVTTSLDV